MKHTSIGRQLRWVLPALLIGYATVHRLGQTYGSTSRERHARMPGDGIVAKPQFVITHGITIDARPESVWPWLVQMGWHRGGWYTHVGSTSSCFRQTEQAQIKYSKSFKIFRSVTSYLTAHPKPVAASLLSSLNRHNFSFCTPPLTCLCNGAAKVRRQLIGRGFSMSCRSTLEVAPV